MKRIKKTTTFIHIRTIYSYIYVYKTPKKRGSSCLSSSGVSADRDHVVRLFVRSCVRAVWPQSGAGSQSQPGTVHFLAERERTFGNQVDHINELDQPGTLIYRLLFTKAVHSRSGRANVTMVLVYSKGGGVGSL